MGAISSTIGTTTSNFQQNNFVAAVQQPVLGGANTPSVQVGNTVQPTTTPTTNTTTTTPATQTPGTVIENSTTTPTTPAPIAATEKKLYGQWWFWLAAVGALVGGIFIIKKIK